MKRLLLVAIAVVAAFAARPATSADLPMAPVYQPPPPIVPVYSWTGCYLGGTVGTGWSSWNYSNPTDNLPVPGFRGDILANDVVAGGQVGCDYQAGEFVFGVQGMGDWTQMKGRFFDAVTGQFQETAQARWFATATGRIGYTITPPTLIYVTAPPGSATNTRTLLTLRLVALSPAASALVATRLTVPPALPNLAGLSA